MHKNFWVLVFILLFVSGVAFFATQKNTQDSQVKDKGPLEGSDAISFTDTKTGLIFSYPAPWGQPLEAPGNKICPTEDTYRTGETSSLFDRELRFQDIDLEGTDSFIRSGIRFYEITPGVSNDCNDDFLQSLAQREITGEEISSVRLVPVNLPGFYGVHNEQASRLDTEYREQYTLFKTNDGKILIIQPYLSFVPYFNSPEWQEIEKNYPNNILAYARSGDTAKSLQDHIKAFRQMVESFQVTP